MAFLNQWKQIEGLDDLSQVFETQTEAPADDLEYWKDRADRLFSGPYGRYSPDVFEEACLTGLSPLEHYLALEQAHKLLRKLLVRPGEDRKPPKPSASDLLKATIDHVLSGSDEPPLIPLRSWPRLVGLDRNFYHFREQPHLSLLMAGYDRLGQIQEEINNAKLVGGFYVDGALYLLIGGLISYDPDRYRKVVRDLKKTDPHLLRWNEPKILILGAMLGRFEEVQKNLFLHIQISSQELDLLAKWVNDEQLKSLVEAGNISKERFQALEARRSETA